MPDKKRITRRQVTKLLGAGTALGLLSPRLTAGTVVTPAQTSGPFHPVDERDDLDFDMTRIDGHRENATGEVILVRGRVCDTEGNPISGAVVDVWQANHHGRYSHHRDPNEAPLDPHFQDWALLSADDKGRYGFKTIKPGAYPLKFLGGDGWRCRHIHFKVTSPGHADLVTQMYFAGDPLIEQDQEIAKVDEQHRHLLIAQAQTDEATGLPRYRFDVTLAKA